MRARSFSRVKGWVAGLGRKVRRALREVVGEEFVAFTPIPTTEMYSFEE
jgi:hypothetical protein